jgi:hypothetical protein
MSLLTNVVEELPLLGKVWKLQLNLHNGAFVSVISLVKTVLKEFFHSTPRKRLFSSTILSVTAFEEGHG